MMFRTWNLPRVNPTNTLWGSSIRIWTMEMVHNGGGYHPWCDIHGESPWYSNPRYSEANVDFWFVEIPQILWWAAVCCRKKPQQTNEVLLNLHTCPCVNFRKWTCGHPKTIGFHLLNNKDCMILGFENFPSILSIDPILTPEKPLCWSKYPQKLIPMFPWPMIADGSPYLDSYPHKISSDVLESQYFHYNFPIPMAYGTCQNTHDNNSNWNIPI